MKPETAQNICESISAIFSDDFGTINFEPNFLSTIKTIPSFTAIPMAEWPNYDIFIIIITFIASIAYST